MSETDKSVRVLTQAVEISKQLMDMLENDKRQLLDDLDFRRNLYAELKKLKEGKLMIFALYLFAKIATRGREMEFMVKKLCLGL